MQQTLPRTQNFYNDSIFTDSIRPPTERRYHMRLVCASFLSALGMVQLISAGLTLILYAHMVRNDLEKLYKFLGVFPMGQWGFTEVYGIVITCIATATGFLGISSLSPQGRHLMGANLVASGFVILGMTLLGLINAIQTYEKALEIMLTRKILDLLDKYGNVPKEFDYEYSQRDEASIVDWIAQGDLDENKLHMLLRLHLVLGALCFVYVFCAITSLTLISYNMGKHKSIFPLKTPPMTPTPAPSTSLRVPVITNVESPPAFTRRTPEYQVFQSSRSSSLNFNPVQSPSAPVTS